MEYDLPTLKNLELIDGFFIAWNPSTGETRRFRYDAATKTWVERRRGAV